MCGSEASCLGYVTPMLETRPERAEISIPEIKDFSLVLGGPLFQLFRRAYLSGDHLDLLIRRVVLISAFAWLPILFLSLLDGRAFGGTIKVPFLYDVEAHARFLVALPALIIA